jgi:hypothetical protein
MRESSKNTTKNRNLQKNFVAGFSNHQLGIHPMPNQHSPDKEVIGFYIPRTLAMRVRRAAKTRGLTITAFVEETLTHATRKTILTPEDYLQIAQATKDSIRHSASKRTGRKGKK